MKTFFFPVVVFTLLTVSLSAQKTDSNVFGDVKCNGEHIPFASIHLKGTTTGTTTDETGHYMLVNLPVGNHILVAKALGYVAAEKEVTIVANQSLEVNFELKEEVMSIDEVVITATKTARRQTETPVIVNVLNKNAINAVQACNISEGLKFQPGLRVETDCQTCNYSQLRMNGLGGGYSQILINGRPVFSPLIGLYGMEQIPANMVDRIEVVRGGGSALYGSSAIGGTVNIITHIPNTNDYSVSYTSQLINKQASDQVLNANVTMVSRQRKAGAVLFASQRKREAYDHPGLTLNRQGTFTVEKDNFSELPELRDNSFGGNIYFRPAPEQKLEISFTSLYEYRYGGEMTRKAAHLAQQSEERVHHTFMGGLDYQINFNQDQSSFITYFAGQFTDRDHYTGLYPSRDDFPTGAAFAAAEESHLKNPPYGFTENRTLQGGVQLNHRISDFFNGKNIVTVGAEYLYDDVSDSIPAYRYGTLQETGNLAGFLQSDWQVNGSLTVLLGLRADKHNLVEYPILSPRISFLYKLRESTQFRLTWGTGFRAPQAFDADMHIAFAGGGVSRISLDPALKEERSNSFSGSVNFDKKRERYIYGFTLEGFYTKLNKAFYLQPSGEDQLGSLFVKRNGPGAAVQGATVEIRGNYRSRVQVEAGMTFQTSLHDVAVENIQGLEARREFLRTPQEYGYGILTLNPSGKLYASFSSVFTGPMLLAKFSPDKSLRPDEYKTSPSFTEMNVKVGYTFSLPVFESGLEVFAGVKNLTNAFQDDFDNYKNRDSNYIYGPSAPRTIYFGVKIKSI